MRSLLSARVQALDVWLAGWVPPTIAAPRSQTDPEKEEAERSSEEDEEGVHPVGTGEAEAHIELADAINAHGEAGAVDAKEAGIGPDIA